MHIPPQKLQLVVDDDPTVATFVIAEEDHTLGNALRYLIARNRDTEFVGYSQPHWSEFKIHMRVQTKCPLHYS